MKKHLVWDIPVRLFHWLLVLCLLGQWLTAEVLEDAMDIHFYIGYFTLGLIIFRLIWGFVGTKYAKFNSFISGPKVMLAYIRNIRTKQQPLSIGHNSVGGLLLPAVLILVGLQAISGLFTSDDIVYSGPYYDSANADLQQWMQWLHHNIFDVLLGIIGLHLLAIGWYLIFLKHNLIKPMLDGKKAVALKDGITHSQLLKAIVIICLVAIFVYWLVEINPPPIEDGYYY
ncbi:cytochrome b/b6 domain-containing protein [uncultured Paraglaciecola sp.]|uniref:cytochrome b/b6 domain-containing protein n=1 Tax=uncultured Paraglaciecola sp. TaxID=1765024 RepID=UPI0030D9B483|tara:strand:- start:15240 stop:15923 length:684 start_codon:yes stop_codon:yes gene_type:complete